MSFIGQRFLTKGIQTEIPFELQLFMWYLVSNLPEPKDYLQVFRLSISNRGTQRIIHEQEESAYSREYEFQTDNPINTKVYVIDDDDHCTMLLAEEY